MLPSLPILVFGALFMMWSRTSLASPKQTNADDNNSDNNKIIVKIVQPEKSA